MLHSATFSPKRRTSPKIPIFLKTPGQRSILRLGERKSRYDSCEQLLLRITAAQQHPDSSGVANNHCTYFEYPQADGANLTSGKLSALQAMTPKCLQQDIGNAREQQAKLIRPPSLATGPIGKQAKLLLLDAVFHIPSGTVHFLIEMLRITLKIGHHIARIATLPGVLSFHDYPTFFVPGGSCIRYETKPSLLLSASQVLFFGLLMETSVQRQL